MTGWVIINGNMAFNGAITINDAVAVNSSITVTGGQIKSDGLITDGNSTGAYSQTIAAGYAAYTPRSYEVVNGYSLTIADTAILEVG